MRRRWLLSAIVTVIALTLVIEACSGGDDADDDRQATPPASGAPRGDLEPAPPSAGQLPPEFRRCMADKGFPIESPDEIHSAPQQVLLACFGSLHGGGQTP
jgi:hypothetical protein